MAILVQLASLELLPSWYKAFAQYLQRLRKYTKACTASGDSDQNSQSVDAGSSPKNAPPIRHFLEESVGIAIDA